MCSAEPTVAMGVDRCSERFVRRFRGAFVRRFRGAYVTVRRLGRKLFMKILYSNASCRSISSLFFDILPSSSLTEPLYLLSTIHLSFCLKFEKKPESEGSAG